MMPLEAIYTKMHIYVLQTKQHSMFKPTKLRKKSLYNYHSTVHHSLNSTEVHSWRVAG